VKPQLNKLEGEPLESLIKRGLQPYKVIQRSLEVFPKKKVVEGPWGTKFSNSKSWVPKLGPRERSNQKYPKIPGR